MLALRGIYGFLSFQSNSVKELLGFIFFHLHGTLDLEAQKLKFIITWNMSVLIQYLWYILG